MEGVRRDPEKCTFNPATWSLTVVDDYVYMCLLYQRPIYSGNYSRRGGGGVLPVLAIQIFWYKIRDINNDHSKEIGVWGDWGRGAGVHK